MVEKLENRSWKVLDSRYVAKEGPWFTVRREKVELPFGVVIPSWYIFEFPDWINVIAIDREGRHVMISQYRHAIAETRYELVAGVIDDTDASPMDAARRELEEETGYGGGEWSQFMCLSPNPTNHTNRSFTFVARGVYPVSAQHAEQGEDIRVHLMDEDEVLGLLESGEIIQALHAAPLWKYFANRNRQENTY